MIDQKYLECGKIVNTHGCMGGVKAESWCNSEKDLASLKKIFLINCGTERELTVKRASVFKQFVIFDFEEITNMDEAMMLKNSIIYAKREDFRLAKGEYFLADLIGLEVIDADNSKHYGKLKDIINRGASDIYVVETDRGERMIPAVSEFIIGIDLKKGIAVRPIEGMLD